MKHSQTEIDLVIVYR